MTTMMRAAVFTVLAACGQLPGTGATTSTTGGTTGGSSACTRGVAQGSCFYNSSGQECDEISGYSQSYASSFMTDCTGNATRTYSASGCPQSNKMGQKTVGACSISIGGGCFTSWSYPPSTASDDMMGCMTAGGTWTPAP
jgi:hypothetical protein